MKSRRELFRKALALTDVDDSEAAEVSIFRAKGAVYNRHILNQFRAQRFKRTQVSLSMALRSLVLLNIIDKHLKAAIHASMIQVEPEAPDLERFSAAFMLPRIDSSIELL